MDTVFICMALNNDFNLRRLERYLSIEWDSEATLIVVLTKSDLCDVLQSRFDEVSIVTIGVDVLTTPGLSEDGFLAIKGYMALGKTFVFIGSSCRLSLPLTKDERRQILCNTSKVAYCFFHYRKKCN
ncbi:GTPase RsgA [Paenibacillus sp. WQ 127069]|uniref:GTPase RsgA n=2 Tax=Paenibacillus baimaensis TaxID=2982185 RepID=A0ABT2UD46_9BACL|nr:GTPase RsgA [Paenibacillus sp. WQ 127069]MCU6792556.1 GTPase RsgA [Paenibacillus sp. WQ 127069]